MTSLRTKLVTTGAAVALGAGGLGLLASPADAATATAAPSAKAAACDKAPWEATVQGAPKGFGAGSASGDYLWHSTTGFHLRVTHGTNHDVRVYSGEVTSSQPMRIDPVKLEKGDTLTLAANHKSFVFVFANHGYVDGVNFHTDCATALKVSNLHVGSSSLPASRVDLGAHRAHPKAVPFTVHRHSAV
jgi:hypothetical protein